MAQMHRRWSCAMERGGVLNACGPSYPQEIAAIGSSSPFGKKMSCSKVEFPKQQLFPSDFWVPDALCVQWWGLGLLIHRKAQNSCDNQLGQRCLFLVEERKEGQGAWGGPGKWTLRVRVDGVPWDVGHPRLSAGRGRTAIWRCRRKGTQWNTIRCLQHTLCLSFLILGELFYNALQIVANYRHTCSILLNRVSTDFPPPLAHLMEKGVSFLYLKFMLLLTFPLNQL